MNKASLGIALIARNAAKTIGACLDSIVPYAEQVVVCVDVTTTDDTAQVAREHGAEVYEGLAVSEEHECPHHGKVMAQHFARARTASFSHLRSDLDFWGWLDADDIVKGGEKLAEALGKCGPEVAGLWLSYHYSQAMPGGPTATLFDRERIVRPSVGWQWQYRVHEILAPIGRPAESLTWSRTDDIAVYHQGEGHDTAGSARRNILLLEIDLEEDPNDMRAQFYMGNQYFALGDWGAAIHWFERAMAAENVYQRWQTALYLSMAYERVGDLDACKQAAYVAADIAPYHPEPYLRLAAAAMLQGDVPRCEWWTRLAHRDTSDPPFFAFKNPLDKTYNSHITLGTAYANNGQISRARAELEKAAAVLPSPVVLEGIKQYRTLEEETEQAEAWVRVLNAIEDNGDGFWNPAAVQKLPVWKFGRVRDVVVPRMLRQRANAQPKVKDWPDGLRTIIHHPTGTPNTQPRAVFYCGRSAEPWAPPSIDTTGIGGSETAVIQIAKRFQRDGWRVDVYNDCDRYEGEYDEVGYWNAARLGAAETADLLVAWRNPRLHDLPLTARARLLWCHDLNSGPDAAAHLAKWDRVLGVSAWHAAYMAQVYELSNTGHVPNGIDLDRFAGTVARVPFRCVYASSPDRGLERLLQLWPRIVAQEPSAELHVAYGWETMDKYIAHGATHLLPFKQYITRLLEQTPRVVWRGRLPQNELARLYQESYALLYPSDFLEVSCIVAMEAMAAGCVAVTSGAGALPETVGNGGLVVNGNVYTRAWRDYFTHIARGVLHTPDIRQKYALAGQERAKVLTWDHSYERWKEIVTGLLEGKREAVLV